MQDDPDTSFAYASLENYCGHCKPRVVPMLVHQETYCCREAHKDCPVYAQDGNRAFPAQWKAKGQRTRKQSMQFLFPSVVALLIVFSGWWMVNQNLDQKQNAAMPPAYPTTVVTSASAIPVASNTPRPPQPSKTSVPQSRTPLQPSTRMPTSTPGIRALEILFKVGEREFLLHRVREGENFEILKGDYETTTEVILALNDSLSSPLWANRVIVISPGMQAVDPELPTFQSYEVTDEEILIDDLAQMLNTDPSQLRYYNNCPDNCRLLIGDWVLIPHP